MRSREPFPRASSGTLTSPAPSAGASLVVLVVVLLFAWAGSAIASPAPACARPCSVTWQTPARVPVTVASRLLPVGSSVQVDRVSVDGVALRLRDVAGESLTVRGRGARVRVDARGGGRRWFRLRFTARTDRPRTVVVVYRTVGEVR